MKRRIILLSIALCALATITTGRAQLQGQDGGNVPRVVNATGGLVNLGPGQRARFVVLNSAQADPAHEKSGAIAITIKFLLYQSGQPAGNGALTHAAVGEHSSGEVTLGPGQALSLMSPAGQEWLRPMLSFSSLPGGTAGPLKTSLSLFDGNGQVLGISIDVVSAGFYEGWPARWPLEPPQ